MEERCVLSVIFIFLSLTLVHCKVFTRCQLTRELLKTNFHQKTFLSNWVCLIEQESDRNTSAHVVKTSRKQYYGMFQIGSEWCKEGRKGGRCDVSCESLLDDDIKDDLACAFKIFEDEGFKYWTKWTTRCKGERLPDIEKCPDWQHPPRASPERMKRTPKIKRRFTRQISHPYLITALRRIYSNGFWDDESAVIGRHLREQKARNKNTAVSLLDCSLRGVTSLPSASIADLAGVGLHGLVISSGDIKRVQQGAFNSVSSTLLALGLPNNQLPLVPTEAIIRLGNLDRLDLSNNKIHTLDTNSFKGIQNLTYLDISDNQLTSIADGAFQSLAKLAVLRLRGNLLKVSALTALKEANMLKELDVSSNALEGPVGPSTVPSLCYLETLHLSDNTFASIRRGALSGLTNLTHLNLHNNQIDVLEDYAFKHLTNLSHLDLSHNEIVAVSGASLAQLTNLMYLDLSHNFLRSLSAEPLKALHHLTELLLHDNDISMIDDGALLLHKDLERFTVEDNPLNCDCLMAGFARWLREAKNLPQSDKSAAACATPPHLEGALISRLSKNKLCDDDHIETKAIDEASYDYNKLVDNTIDIDKVDDLYGDKLDGLDDDAYDEELEVPGEEDLPISKSEVRLIDAWYDDEEVHLSWVLDPLSPLRYRCTGVTASKAGGLPKHVACHRALPANIVLRGFKIDPVEKYTFCVALEELDNKDVPMALVLGCGTPLLVRQRAAYITVRPDPIVVPDREPIRVSEVRSNVTSDGLLTVLISVLGIPTPKQYVLPRSQRVSMPDRYLHNCYVVLAVLSRGSLVAQKDTPCQDTLAVSMEGFVRGPYEVCATISKFKTDEMHPICIVPQLLEPVGTLQMKSGLKNLNTALVGIALGLMIIVIGLVWFVRKMLKKPSEFQTHRCFRTEPVTEENPRASYVMLTATSKV